ncbi:amino acid adenylation domain-containing protein [Pseudomonas sp. TE3610]
MTAVNPRHKANIQVVAPITSVQKGILAYALKCGNQDPYHYQQVFSLRGDLQVAAFHQALQHTVDRHQALRADYRWEEVDVPVQIVFKQVPVGLPTLDWSACSRDEQWARLRQLLADKRAAGFAFRQAADLSFNLVKVGPDEHWLVWSYHHISLDGWGLGLALRDTLVAYRALAAGQELAAQGGTDYVNYLTWLQARHDQARTEAYWRGVFPQSVRPTPLPYQAREVALAGRYGERAFDLDQATTHQLNAVCRQAGVTLNTLVQGAWALLLARFAGQDEVIFGTTLSGRSPEHDGVENIVGLFINTLPARVAVLDDQPLGEWLKGIQAQALLTREHEHSALQDILKLTGNDEGKGLFDSILVFENFPLAEAVQGPEQALSINLLPSLERGEGGSGTAGRSNYPLSLMVEPGSCLGLLLAWHCEHFSDAAAGQIIEQLTYLLHGMARGAQQRVGEVRLLAPQPATPAPAPAPQATVLQYFAEAVARTPQTLAIRDEREALTFARLDQASDQVALRLQAHGWPLGTPVALLLERSCDWVVALLGVLKAGLSYVPLEPSTPMQRLAAVLRQSGAPLLIGRQTEPLADTPCQDIASLRAGDARYTPCSLPAASSAYLIYTSGSTGAPKGVDISHGALYQYVTGLLARVQMPADASMAMVSTVAADLGHTVLFGALCSGRTLHLLSDEQVRDPDTFAHYMAEHQVGVLKIVPSHLRALLQAASPADVLPAHALILGGEACDWPLLELAASLKPGCRLYNHYGPSETTVGVLATQVHPQQPHDVRVPLGVPLGQAHVYVLDDQLNALPSGAIGELYVAGPTLANGYRGAPGHSAERFLANPFGQGERLYRTGDRVRQRLDGALEFFGRGDEQIKLRGYRIETGDITVTLKGLAGVRDAVVVLEESGQAPQLVAYLVLAADGAVEAVRALAAERLPDYMVPSRWMALPAMPLTANGKLDRKALPVIEQAAGERLAPRTPQEQLLAEVWADVLKVPAVGVNENFFELGGDSILSLQIIARARRRGLKLSSRQIFEMQTIEQLAASIGDAVGAAATVQHQGPRGTLNLLPVARRFFERQIPHAHHWNQSVLLASRQPLVPQRLEQAVDALIRQHDALRLRFHQVQGQWQGEFAEAPPASTVIGYRRARDEQALRALCDEAQRSLDLAQGPLLRVLLVDMADGSQRLLLVIHHLVVDGVSWRVLLEDLQGLYEAGAAHVLPAKTASLQQWANCLEALATSPALHGQLPFWLAQGSDAVQPLPCAMPDREPSNASACTLSVSLDRDRTTRLLKQAPAAYRTQINDLLLTALARTLCRWTQGDSCLVQLEGHGREPLDDTLDLSRSVGWFTSLFPVQLTPADTLDGSIKAIKEQLRAVPGKGLGFGVLRYLADAQVVSQLAGLPVPRVTFNYLGQLDSSFAADGLLAPASEGTGANQSADAPMSNWLTINSHVHDGQLSFNWIYSSEQFEHATLQGVADDYLQELDAVIQHCCAPEAGGLTPADFPLAGLDQGQLDRLALVPRTVEDIYPLAPMQQGLLFHSVNAPASGLYVNQVNVRVHGIDLARFRAAWGQVIGRHAILRTGFLWQDELKAPLQVVRQHVEVPVSELDWRGKAPANLEPELLQLAQAERIKGFDLQQAPLLRLVLVRTSEHTHHLIWTSHHILMDGWSSARLISEMMQAYLGDTLPRVTGRYRDYLAWLGQQDQGLSDSFWRERLQALDEPTLLAQSLPCTQPGSGHGVTYTRLDASATQQLQAFAQAQRVTLNTLVQAAWTLLLQAYTGQRTLAFGATVSGRPAGLPGSEEMLGLFINTLPVIQTPRSGQPIGEWLRELQAYNLALREHEHTPLSQVQRLAGLGGQALFDSIIVFENYPVDRAFQARTEHGLRFEKPSKIDVTHFAMDLAVSVGLTLEIEYLYLRDKFETEHAERLRGHMEHLLLSLAQDATRPLGQVALVPLLTPQALAPMPGLAPLHQRIAEKAASQPQSVAVLCQGRQLTFAQLDDQANRLARHLSSLPLAQRSHIALALPRSEQMIVAMLAVLKAGHAYVPLDTGYPRERLQYLLEDAAVALLITHSQLQDNVPVPATGLRLLLDRLDMGQAVAEPMHTAVHPDDLAYLIYTSGSTGQPKGVAVAHGALAAHCAAIGERYEMSAGDRELLFMSFAFDGAQERWLTALSHGASLVVRDDELWTAERTYQALQEYQVTVAAFPPVYLQQLTEEAERDGNPPPVRVYCFGGEAVPQASFERAKAALRPQFIINGYGPTETVITPLLWKADADMACQASYAPIGTAVGERSLHVLDGHLNPVPTGVAGELYIGGHCLARGYHQRPGLTAERFVADPFSVGARLYRTGDLVRQREDGLIDYLGRIDHQVKVRGFRIELGEAEACLRAQPQVREAVVVATAAASGKQLLAYVVLAPGQADEAAALASLRVQLATALPDYMVPAQWCVLARLPLMPNGKLDRQALPAVTPGTAQQGYRAPRTALEKALAEIWQNVLQVEQVGLDDNFFELGGDSILSLQVVARSRSLKGLGFSLKLRELMQKPTIAQLLPQEAGSDAPQLLLSMNSAAGDAPAVFCVHAGFGTVFDYEPLARRLDGQRRVYGIQSRMLLEPGWQDDSLEQMARDYVQAVRGVQPQGPYLLLGWSLGATLATLMAAELEGMGQRVELLGLIDGYVPNPQAASTIDDWRHDLREFLGLMAGERTVPPVPPGAESREAVSASVHAFLDEGADPHSFAARLGCEELTQVFCVARQLKHLSRRLPACPAVQAVPLCWWIGRREADAQRLNSQLGQQAVGQAPLACGHFEVMHNASLLEALQGLLGHSLESAR